MTTSMSQTTLARIFARSLDQTGDYTANGLDGTRLYCVPLASCLGVVYGTRTLVVSGIWVPADVSFTCVRCTLVDRDGACWRFSGVDDRVRMRRSRPADIIVDEKHVIPALRFGEWTVHAVSEAVILGLLRLCAQLDPSEPLPVLVDYVRAHMEVATNE